MLRTLWSAKAAPRTSMGPMTMAQKWKVFGSILLGKLIGVALLFGAYMLFRGQTAHADETYTAHETTMMSVVNTVWTLIAAFLVFGMQAGFVFLEAGFARTKEAVNILVECIFDTCLCGLLFWAFGYAFMFSHGNGFIGLHWFFLQGSPDTYETTGVALLAHWIFQFAFADTCSTVTSGAMIGRTGFRGDILYSAAVTGFIYPIFGHWAWGPDGWLTTMGSKDGILPNLAPFHDFAGSTVVHSIGGFVSLAGAIVLGPRIGRIFARDDKERGGQMPPHNLVVAAVGGFILWFGWYGFNPGSTLSAMDFQGISRIAANTTIAACLGGFSAMFAAFFIGPTKGKWDVGYSINGMLGGLVAITCPCYWVSMGGSVAIGFVAGIVVFYGVQFIEWLRIDDPVGAVAVHGFAGVWGTLSLGLFARGLFGSSGPTGADNSAGAVLKGWFYGGGPTLFIAQLIGSVAICGATFITAFIVMKIIRALPHPWNLRVEKEGELGPGGLDVWEHGIEAYPSQA